MNWLLVLWPMFAAACITLAVVYAIVWLRNRQAWVNLFFALMALGSALLTFCELGLLLAKTPSEFATISRWGHLPIWLVIISVVGFVHTYLGSGRTWLAWSVVGTRTLALILNFIVGQNLNHLEVTGLRFIPFLGQSVPVAEAVRNPWMLIGQFSTVLLLVYVADASLAAARRGDRRKAWMVGGSILLFLSSSLVETFLVNWGIIRAPILISPFFLGMVAAMAYELSGDILRASQLVGQLQASESQLRESEKRLSLAVDAGNFGVWIRDLSGSNVWASEKWRELFGFAAGEPVTLERVLARVHPGDRAVLLNAQEAAADGDGAYECEYRLPQPDGGTRWIGSHGRVEFDEKRRPVLVRGVVRDISARKQSELDMDRLQNEIAHAGRVSMMGQLAAALAHEINQPLGAILRNAEAADLYIQQPVPDLNEIRAILADIRDDDARAGAVIDRMRALLKRQDLDKELLKIDHLVGDVVAFVRTSAEARHIRLQLNVAAGLPRIAGERVHLQQVMLNLIINGMDSLDGASAEKRRVDIDARSIDPTSVQISVSDRGHGIPPDRIEKIFEPFFTTKADGLGMGLSISRTIVEAHHGHLRAANNDHGGATFVLTLPAASAVG